MENNAPYIAVSYETETYKDLCMFLSNDGIELNRVSPEDFLAGIVNTNAFYINLVVQDTTMRQLVSSALDLQRLQRFTYVHPSVVASGANIGIGVFLYPSTTIYRNVTINNDTIIHSHCVIAHNTVIGNGCYLSGGISIGGSTIVGEYCTLGLDATVYDRVNIAPKTILGARTVVRKSITTAAKFGSIFKLIRMK